MEEKLEQERKLRLVLRRSYTRICTTLENLIKINTDLDNIQAQMELLEVRVDELTRKNYIIYEILVEGGAFSEKDLDIELEKVDEYVLKYYIIKNVAKLTEMDQTFSITDSKHQSLDLHKPDIKVSDCSYKLPKFKFKEFSGEIKYWLPFWSQFKKIDSDVKMDPEEKVQYLVMATAPNSAARKVVESYPATGDMYPEIIALKDRFGRPDLLTEYYNREFLRIIFQNKFPKSKMPLASLYDKLLCHLRNLDTLGTTIECSGSNLLPPITDKTYKCNFAALDQTKICGTITPIKEGPWIQELAIQNMELSDDGTVAPIEILKGADIAGKLLTGNTKLLDSGLVALETLLGWTLMAKFPNNKQETFSYDSHLYVRP